MLYSKNEKEDVKRSYDYLHSHDGVIDKAKKRRKKGRTYLSEKPKN